MTGGTAPRDGAPASRGVLQRARILIVDDQVASILLLKTSLELAGCSAVTSTTDPREAVPLFDATSPDLVVLDLHMPQLSGIEVLHQLQERIPAGTYLPVLVLTADTSAALKEEALAGGAKDFLHKPFSPSEAVLRIKNLLDTRFLYLQVQQQNALLEVRVRERTDALEDAYLEMLERLALAAEYRDDQTGQHAQRVGQRSAEIALTLGLDAAQAEMIRRAALLHDIGKIGIPDDLLLKPGRLSTDEFRHMQAHTHIGSRIVSGSHSPLLRLAEEVARTHHERWDGTGYGSWLSGEKIPLAGRIVAVADVFDALIHRRPYKPAWPVAEAIAEIERQRGRQFDPAVVDAFLSVIRRSLADPQLA